MNKSIPLNSIDNNARPYGIFMTYLLTCLGVAVFIITKLFEKTERLYTSAPSRLPQKRHVVIFATLATCSLFSTWGFMFQYFQWSYNNWLTVRSQHDLDPTVKHWGLWLKETSLFREAWESVIVGHNRYWWSHQIFYWACALGLHLEWKGVRRGITYTWAFMLLGQIVAISFATNLYFLTLLLSPPQQQPITPNPKEFTNPKESRSEAPELAPVSKPRKWLGPWLIDGLSVTNTYAAANCLSRENYWNGSPGFMPLLLVPHVVLLILPMARAILPAKFFPIGDPKTVNKIYKFLWTSNFTFVGQLVWTTYKAYLAGNLGGIRDALLEHPAVGSVGFDVIFCWISWICWWQIQSDKSSYVMSDL
ncbi:hypothetical protein BU25DRAFT_390707 [Macroventuria anomochaeta]|uniref:Uncharacterized protein n=1 Tax=Macroventuria anomochaeta TaxID=301207 RepID=A0ACB6S5K7_9PLEO|nr:uncharacterized protein BU25DRAFT_390707 [Macroventuria anomochaeta]KAF2628797.1 hypothetical protein BU25DRAFT_390707 [Macroventuria anomochaeta]